MRIRIAARSLVLFAALFAAAPVAAQVGDPTIRTDHPLYAGEGAFQSVGDCVAFATAGKAQPQEQALALYNWLLTHQWHLASPQDWCIPGREPDTAQQRDYENVVYDANIGRFSYGYGLCGTVHAWNEPYWQELGMRARRRAFPGHTNSEVYYGGTWHAFDTDMAGLLFRPDGIVAGYDDIIADPSLADSVQPPHPHYPFAWPGDFNTMKKGWQQVAAGGNWYAMYNGGYAAQPGIVQLRRGETFTRWYDPDHYGGPSQRRFWHHMPGGPSRPWSFFGQETPFHDGAKHNARNDVAYCNGEFVYRPDVAAQTTRDAGRSVATFTHWSPYVIAGDPQDDANPMTGPATGGLVVTGRMARDMHCAVSADEGQSWREVPVPPRRDQSFRLDLTDDVKGRFGWQVRFAWDEANAGPEDLEFTTVTQVNPAMYPQLTSGGSEVTYRAASRAVVCVTPDFGLPESELHKFESLEHRSPNVSFHGRSEASRYAYRTTDNRPGQIVFKVDAPERLSEVRAAVRYQVRVPPPENADYHLDVSTDGGSSWQTFATADIPADNEHSSGWLAGSVDLSAAGVRNALVRVHLYGGGHQTGLIDARLYGIHHTSQPGPVRFTCGWKEDGQLREHSERIAAGTSQMSFVVPTGQSVENDFVRLAAE